MSINTINDNIKINGLNLLVNKIKQLEHRCFAWLNK